MRSRSQTRLRPSRSAGGPHRGQQGRSALFPWLIVGAVLIVVLAGRLLMTTADRQLELPELGTVPPFVLLDSSGERFSSTSLASHVWIASFIYTTCPGPCPRVVQRLAEIRRRFAGDRRLQIVSFSVDPEADTPEVLAAYAHTHAIDPGGWKLLTGDVEDVVEVVRDGFHLGVERAGEDAAPEHGPVVHSTRLVLVSPGMRVRGYYDSVHPADLERIVGDIGTLLATVTR